jgi:AcrR family transcriptional regulator
VRVRHHGGGDTPAPLVAHGQQDPDESVTSVARVTGGASAASRSARAPASPAAAAPGRSEAGSGAVPAEQPRRPTLVPGNSPGNSRGQRKKPGARERRRLETRERIVAAAADLFAERGFDAVSVVEIARRAGVVEKTVFNHFPVKEGLVFEADPPIREALLEAARRRPAGESVSAAAGSFVVRAMAVLGSPEAAPGVAEMARVVRGSRTLQIREREILGELTAALAGLIAEETRAPEGALEPGLAANAVVGLYAALLDLARDRVLAGESGPRLVAELRGRGERGLALLQFGLAGYAKRPA